jgi:hypothetical protein
MKEQDAIDRMVDHSRQAFPHVDERTTVEVVTAAWNEMKAIAQEDTPEARKAHIKLYGLTNA